MTSKDEDEKTEYEDEDEKTEIENEDESENED